MATRTRQTVSRSTSLAALALIAAASLACQSFSEPSATPSASIPGALPAETTSALFDKLPGGVLYALIGPIFSGNVWMLDLDSRIATQLTQNPPGYGISNFDASTAGLVMGDAASGVDMVTVYRDGTVENILPGGLHAGDPAVSSTGKVAVVGIPDDDTSGTDSWEILILGLDGGDPQLLYEQRGPDLSLLDLGGLAWGPGNRLAALSASGSRFGKGTPELIVLDEDGETELRLRPTVDEVHYMAWSEGAPGIAISDLVGDAVLVDLDGTQHPLASGWTPQCWAADGSALLVTQQQRDGFAFVGQVKVGIWRPDDADQVEHIVDMPEGSPLWGCSWLATPAAHTP